MVADLHAVIFPGRRSWSGSSQRLRWRRGGGEHRLRWLDRFKVFPREDTPSLAVGRTTPRAPDRPPERRGPVAIPRRVPPAVYTCTDGALMAQRLRVWC